MEPHFAAIEAKPTILAVRIEGRDDVFELLHAHPFARPQMKL